MQVGAPFRILASTGTLSQADFNWVRIDLTGNRFGSLSPSTSYWVALLPGATYTVPPGSIGMFGANCAACVLLITIFSFATVRCRRERHPVGWPPRSPQYTLTSPP